MTEFVYKRHRQQIPLALSAVRLLAAPLKAAAGGIYKMSRHCTNDMCDLSLNEYHSCSHVWPYVVAYIRKVSFSSIHSRYRWRSGNSHLVPSLRTRHRRLYSTKELIGHPLPSWSVTVPSIRTSRAQSNHSRLSCLKMAST